MEHNNNNENIAYTADCAMSFYDQLEDVCTADFTIREKYAILRDIFKRVVNQALPTTASTLSACLPSSTI